MNHFEKRIGKDDPHEKWHFDQIIGYLEHFKNKKILDVGCGRGLLVKKLNERNTVTGMDLLKDNPHKIKKIISNASKKFPFKNQEFNVIICSHYLEHSSDPDTSLKEIKRVLKDNGTAFLIVPNEYTWRQKINFLFGNQLPSHKIEEFGHKCIPTEKEWSMFMQKYFKKINETIIPNTHSEGLLWKISRIFGSKEDNADGFLFRCEKK